MTETEEDRRKKSMGRVPALVGGGSYSYSGSEREKIAKELYEHGAKDQLISWKCSKCSEVIDLQSVAISHIRMYHHEGAAIPVLNKYGNCLVYSIEDLGFQMEIVTEENPKIEKHSKTNIKREKREIRLDVVDRLNKLEELNTGTLSFSIACDSVGITQRTVKKHRLDLVKGWKAP